MEKRYQELSKPHRIILWLKWIPFGYIKGFGWYFIKRIKWEDVSEDECGRMSLDTCIGICIGAVQHKMKWYLTTDEVFGNLFKEDELLVEEGRLEKIGNFLEDKFVEIIDRRKRYMKD